MAILYIAAEARELESFASRLTGLRPLKWPLDYAQEGILDGSADFIGGQWRGSEASGTSAGDCHPGYFRRRSSIVSAGSSGKRRLLRSAAAGSTGRPDCGGQPGEGAGFGRVVSSLDVGADQPFVSGTIVSQDRVASTAAEKGELRERFGALAVEMEASGVAARAKRAGLPFCCIKVVSDRADESFGYRLEREAGHQTDISRVGKSYCRVLLSLILFRNCFA